MSGIDRCTTLLKKVNGGLEDCAGKLRELRFGVAELASPWRKRPVERLELEDLSDEIGEVREIVTRIGGTVELALSELTLSADPIADVLGGLTRKVHALEAEVIRRLPDPAPVSPTSRRRPS